MATVRITGGELGGRRIAVPKVEVEGFRPATDRAKVAMFSTLSSLFSFEGITVLELYAGTGALGFECLSRGAASCTFVEQHPKLCRNIEGCIEQFQVKGTVVQGDVSRLLSRGAFKDGSFNLIIAGPPFKLDPTTVLQEIVRADVATPGGWLVAVTERGKSAPEHLSEGRLSAILQKSRTYGDSTLLYYEFGAV